jgi:hypothetical protein
MHYEDRDMSDALAISEVATIPAICHSRVGPFIFNTLLAVLSPNRACHTWLQDLQLWFMFMNF